MKKTVFYKKTRLITAFIAVSLLLFFLACRSTGAESQLSTDHQNPLLSGGMAIVKVNMFGDVRGDVQELSPKASLQRGSNLGNSVQILREEIPFNEEYNLVAELTPVSTPNSSEAAQASLNRNLEPHTQRYPLKAGARYKVVVYDASGEYVTERDYTVGKEKDTDQLALKGGDTYTFIAYSLNSFELPDVNFSNPSHKTLETSSLNNLSGNSDFMYFRKDMQVSGNR
ncbi:hypothetical protein GNY06_10705, partial [Elizabethkingia argentiflava]|nr:hypothetical protein [Elizabethkingia argenteiflava]